MTVLEVLQASTDYLRKRAIENPRLNAEHLLAHVLQRKRIDLYLEFDRMLSDEERAPLRDLVRRRGEGEPLQHLLGTVEFCGLVFGSDKRALVPRPETEELVELVIADSRLRRPGLRIADVGTGSGVIAVALATTLPQATIYAVDVSADALALARENAHRAGVAGRIDFVQSDLLASTSERFDIIVANLPYVSLSERATLSREVLRDPETAVFGGEDGHELIQKLIAEAPAHLVTGGLLALEIGLKQSGRIIGALEEKKFEDIQLKTDYSGTPRFVLARYG
jgi:release factor glutamine methyltransferase